MASVKFDLNTEPHEVEVGPHTFLFEPEVIGAVFASAYSGLKAAQKAVTDAGDNVGEAELLGVHDSMREFLRRFMLEDSRPAFDAAMLPDRVLVQMLEWAAGQYGGGSGNDQPTSSGD